MAVETVLIAGGTGLLGKHLSRLLLDKGYKVRILSRRLLKNSPFEYFVWDVSNGYIDETAFTEVDHIINLAGANIGEKRWTKLRKQQIIDRRVKSTELLFTYYHKLNFPLKTYITASAVGYYGSLTSDKIYTETDTPANDFLGQVCQMWEKASLLFEKEGIRTVQVRTGVVLAKDDGALLKMAQPFKWGLGSVLGNGKQYVPWIHIDDICQMYAFGLENKNMQGAYNATAPEYITNREFSEKLARALDKKIFFPPIPEWVLKLILGKMADLVVKGSRVSSEKLLTTGFTFKHTSIENTLPYLL